MSKSKVKMKNYPTMPYTTSWVLFISTFTALAATPELKTFRVYGGNRAEDRSKFAYHALLLEFDQPLCGGSVIHPRYVLTAGHCVSRSNYKKHFNPKNIRVVVGNLDIKDFPIVRQVQEIIVHEEFAGATLHADIAILKITKSFDEWTKYVHPLPLATQTPQNGYCRVAGWGLTNPNASTFSNYLYYVMVPLVDWAHCKGLYKDFRYKVDEMMICAGSKGKDSCQGDSGGALVCNQTIAGVVSFGELCGVKPGVYTDMAQYGDWVGSKVRALEEKSSAQGLWLNCVVFCWNVLFLCFVQYF